MKAIFLFMFGILASQSSDANPFWSSGVHWDLIQKAFVGTRGDCLMQMKAGSEWVDRLANQMPSHSYMHAMRSGPNQSVREARTLMADFIQSHFEQAVDLDESSTQATHASVNDPFAQYTPDGRLITHPGDYLKSCYERGVGLHPVMDSTSPAHADFAIWSISDLSDLLKHGDLPNSIEDERALFEQPDLMKKTVALMQIVDKLYVDLKMRDFRYE